MQTYAVTAKTTPKPDACVALFGGRIEPCPRGCFVLAVEDDGAVPHRDDFGSVQGQLALAGRAAAACVWALLGSSLCTCGHYWEVDYVRVAIIGKEFMYVWAGGVSAVAVCEPGQLAGSYHSGLGVGLSTRPPCDCWCVWR